MENNNLWIKRGYLKEDFLLFYLKDKKSTEFEFHYHDFNKIIIFISGNVTYLVEGKSYKLKPWDMLLISTNQVHKPIIANDEPYERIIIWVNSRFIEQHNNEECNLLTCFDLIFKEKCNLLRLDLERVTWVKNTVMELKECFKSKEFGSHILKNALFLQLLVYLNRFIIGSDYVKPVEDIKFDKTIEAVLDYINSHLSEELTIDRLAEEFYISKFYLMHKFKNETGYTLHSYILQKRLISGSLLIRKGIPIMETYLECGFEDYTTFIRAFKKQFGQTPKEYLKTIQELEKLK